MKRQIITTAIALGLMASTALSQEATGPTEAVGWGGGAGSWARISPVGEGAEVMLHNELTGGHDMRLDFTLTAGEIVVALRVDHGSGDVPDRFTISPPTGFAAVPEVIDLEEGGTVAIAIVPIVLG